MSSVPFESAGFDNEPPNNNNSSNLAHNEIYHSDDSPSMNDLVGFILKSEMTENDMDGHNVDPSLQYLNLDITKTETTSDSGDQLNVQQATDESIDELLARASQMLQDDQQNLNAYRASVLVNNRIGSVRSIEIVDDNTEHLVQPNFDTMEHDNRPITPSEERVRNMIAEADAALAFAATAAADVSAALGGEDDSILEVIQLRQASPLEIDDVSDDDVIFVGASSPGIVDLCGSPAPPPPDEIPDVQVVNFLLDHTQPPNHRFRRTAGTPRSVCPLVQLMAQQMEESVATSAALAAANLAVETATKAAASNSSPSKRQRIDNPDTADNRSKNISCAVCLEHPFENRPTTTICGHLFCEPCIQMAIKQCKKCPMCNRKLTLKQIHPIYI